MNEAGKMLTGVVVEHSDYLSENAVASADWLFQKSGCHQKGAVAGRNGMQYTKHCVYNGGLSTDLSLMYNALSL